MRPLITCMAAALASASWVLAQPTKPAGLPNFEDYPAQIYTGPLAPPILATPEQRLYRTRIRDGVKAGKGVQRPQGEPEHPGPNFAGHYTIIEFYCGGRSNGQNLFSPMSTSLRMAGLGGEPYLPDAQFRKDSNLMMMQPDPNMGPVYDHYFLWQDNRWKLIRKVKQKPVEP